jgi:hypothetical protein
MLQQLKDDMGMDRETYGMDIVIVLGEYECGMRIAIWMNM